MFESCRFCGTIGHSDGACPRPPVIEATATAETDDESHPVADGASRETDAVAPPAPGALLRIATLNVHSLLEPLELAAVLREHGPFDALGVQEAPAAGAELAQFAARLGMRVAVRRDADFGLANALLVRAAGSDDVARSRSAVEERTAAAEAAVTDRTAALDLISDGEKRAAVALVWPGRLTLVCTHLDAYREVMRALERVPLVEPPRA